MEKDNAAKVFALFARELKIKATAESINNELSKHPDYPSLLAFNDILDYWQMENGAYKLSLESLLEINSPFIAQIAADGSKFVMVHSINKTNVILSDEKQTRKIVPLEKFKERFTGYVLLAAHQNFSAKQNNLSEKLEHFILKLRTPIALILGLVLLGSLISNLLLPAQTELDYLFLFFLHTCGVAITIILLINSLDTDNSLAQKFCVSKSKKGCDTILSSKASKVFNTLSWSEIGFCYFGGTWLIMLFIPDHSVQLHFLAFLTMLSLPYTLFSIFYQYRIGKQFCMLCCSIVTIIWAEFYFLHKLLLPFKFPSIKLIFDIGACMAAPAFIWLFLRPIIVKSNQSALIKRQLHRIKYNKLLFDQLHNLEGKYELLSDIHSLIIGEKDSNQVITMVSNPTCGPCAKTHAILEDWLAHGKKFKLQLIFLQNAGAGNENSKYVAQLLTLQTQFGPDYIREAVDALYKDIHKGFAYWAARFPVKHETDNRDALNAQNEWINQASVTATPTILLNGKRIPSTYGLEDIKYLF